MKKRLDILLTERNEAPSREKAKALIMEGVVYVNGQKEDKPGSEFPEDASIEVRESDNPYVSRGGLKLRKAMELWPIDLAGCVSMDIGASTGGFTDCMLQNGAKRVYSVDVGYGQLDWKLRNDDRVVNLEKTNARTLSENEVPELCDFASIDVSFISLSKIFLPVRMRLKEHGHIVSLVKPQFEAGREKVGKNGVVRELSTHLEVIRNAIGYALDARLTPLSLTYSPIRGPKGNIEYLLYLENTPCEETAEEVFSRLRADDLVRESHELTGGTRC